MEYCIMNQSLKFRWLKLFMNVLWLKKTKMTWNYKPKTAPEDAEDSYAKSKEVTIYF